MQVHNVESPREDSEIHLRSAAFKPGLRALLSEPTNLEGFVNKAKDIRLAKESPSTRAEFAGMLPAVVGLAIADGGEAARNVLSDWRRHAATYEYSYVLPKFTLKIIGDFAERRVRSMSDHEVAAALIRQSGESTYVQAVTTANLIEALARKGCERS